MTTRARIRDNNGGFSGGMHSVGVIWDDIMILRDLRVWGKQHDAASVIIREE